MPVEFLTDEQAARYGRFDGDPTPEQLTQFFVLSDQDYVLVAERRRKHNKLGFAVQLCTLRYLGTFLNDPLQVPAVALKHVAQQLRLPVKVMNKYGQRQETRFEHQRQIREYLGYREFDEFQAFRLIRWLYAQLEISNQRPIELFDRCTAHLVKQKIVLPGVTVLARLVARVRERHTVRTFEGLSQRLSHEQVAALENLLLLAEDQRYTPLEVLRTSPTRVSAPALSDAIARIEEIRAVGVGTVMLNDLPESRLAVLVRHAQTVRVQVIHRMRTEQKLATLLVFVQHLERTATDDVLTVFDALMNKLANTGESRRKVERLRTLKDLDHAALLLREVASIVLNPDVPAQQVRQTVLTTLGEPGVREAIGTVTELASEDDDPAPAALLGSYTTVRKFLPEMLASIEFEGTPSAKPLLDAWGFLKRMEQTGKSRPRWADAPRTFVTKAWERRVFPSKGEVNHQAYTLCVLERLRHALKRREVYVVKSVEYADPRAELLQGAAWQAAREDVLRALERSADPAHELDLLRADLDTAYRAVEQGLPQNDSLSMTVVDGHTRLSLTTLDPLEDTASLKALREAVASRLPNVDLAELLMEIHRLTGLADAFTHVAEGKATSQDLPLSICAVLLAQACNIGLKAVARPEVRALTLSRLSWVQQNYVRADTLVAANARLVNAQDDLPLAQQWGGGEVASADGLRFVVPVRTIHAGWNRKYFGAQRGITYYNFTSDQFTGFHGIVVPGTIRDSLYILAGLLEQQTRLDPREIMADTHGYSDVVFGLFALLGYKFSPRLADLPDQRFWRLDKEADYGALNDLSRHKLNEKLIAAHWEDMLRLAGSLKLGKVGATSVMRTLQRGGSLSGLGKAVAALGRIEKTLYLLQYVDDEAYRQRILRQLNRGELRHSVARAVFHGRKGEIRQKYREGMEDQLGALGLVVNAIVLWNTLYMQEALVELRKLGKIENEADIARLSPLMHEHVNMLGKYDFTLPEDVAEGKLRRLRDPESLEEYLALIN